MRLIYTSTNPQEGRMLSSLLTERGIANLAEVKVVSDWENPAYGDPITHIWVIDEDKLADGLQLIDQFFANPKAPEFATLQKSEPQRVLPKAMLIKSARAKERESRSPSGMTLGIMILCTFLFLYSNATAPLHLTSLPSYLPQMALVSAPIEKELLYDYPKTYEMTNRLVSLYGIEKLSSPEELPEAGKVLLQKILQTPYWKGFYRLASNHLQNIKTPKAPLFEKISEGEFWRTLTPCFLHSEILHLLFNMLWLAVLGKQIEERTGKLRYILLILFAGVFSNTCQYLIGGSDFIGFSGVICAMLTFIWTRQRVATWEGYPLDKSTFIFLMTFILMMAGVQTVSFALENFYHHSISPGIANTAHLSGAAIGFLLGRIPYFSWRA